MSRLGAAGLAAAVALVLLVSRAAIVAPVALLIPIVFALVALLAVRSALIVLRVSVAMVGVALVALIGGLTFGGARPRLLAGLSAGRLPVALLIAAFSPAATAPAPPMATLAVLLRLRAGRRDFLGLLCQGIGGRLFRQWSGVFALADELLPGKLYFLPGGRFRRAIEDGCSSGWRLLWPEAFVKVGVLVYRIDGRRLEGGLPGAC